MRFAVVVVVVVCADSVGINETNDTKLAASFHSQSQTDDI